MAKIDARLVGIERALRSLDGVKERIDDLRPVTSVYAEEMRSEIDDSFQNSVSPWGLKWEPLKAATVESKHSAGYGSKPLIRKGQLKQRINASGFKDALRFGISPSTPYGVFHQQGRGVPYRPFLPFDKRGKFVAKGNAASFLRRLRDSILRYVIRGELPG